MLFWLGKGVCLFFVLFVEALFDLQRGVVGFSNTDQQFDSCVFPLNFFSFLSLPHLSYSFKMEEQPISR